MDSITLKRGRGRVNLIKSEDLIAVKPTSQANINDVLALSPTNVDQVDTGTTLGGFRIIKIEGQKEEMESRLNQIRSHFQVDAGSHVYHTEENSAPIVPTGKLTLRFKPEASDEYRQQIIDEHKLEILDSSVKKNSDGTKTETYTVRTTADSLNPLKVAEALQSSDQVTIAEPDLATPGQLFAFQIPTDDLMKEQWHLKNDGTQFGTSLGLKAGADARVVQAWQRMQSLGSSACTVAVIDDGFDLSHPDLLGSNKIVAPWDFTSNTNNPAPRNFNPDSRFGDYHGTACAGVAVGNVNGSGITGAAPNCRFMPLRWSSSISDDSIRRWFGYAADQGAWVISCSWGVAAKNFPLSTIMDEAISQCATEGRNGLGCVIVFAAGNSNHDINDPDGGTVDGFATHPDVIAVAACNSRDEKSNYSNFGKEISICAPSSGTGGRGILTSDVRGTFQFQGSTFESGYDAGDFTKSFGGTSSATPLVAGICALVLSANPSLTSQQVKTILETSARRIGAPNSYVNGHSILFGHGCVNADAAVKMALSFVAPTTIFADEFWGGSRHELIARVASQKLNESTRERIKTILEPLGNDVGLKDIAGWADEIKGRSASDGGDPDTVRFLTDFPDDASRDWHYIDLPLETDSFAQVENLGFTQGDNVINRLKDTINVLQGTSQFMSAVNALRWIVHLVGDVHQPLHVGCGFIDLSVSPPRIVRDPEIVRQNNLRSDKGGNDIILPLSGNIKLHSYWDSQIPGTITQPPVVHSTGEAVIPSENAIEEDMSSEFSGFEERLIDKGIRKILLSEEELNIISIPVAANNSDPSKWCEEWAMDSLRSAREAYRTFVITQRIGNKYKVSWEGRTAYNTRCRNIVSERLTSAAQHLADLLNAILP